MHGKVWKSLSHPNTFTGNKGTTTNRDWISSPFNPFVFPPCCRHSPPPPLWGKVAFTMTRDKDSFRRPASKLGGYLPMGSNRPKEEFSCERLRKTQQSVDHFSHRYCFTDTSYCSEAKRTSTLTGSNRTPNIPKGMPGIHSLPPPPFHCKELTFPIA